MPIVQHAGAHNLPDADAQSACESDAPVPVCQPDDLMGPFSYHTWLTPWPGGHPRRIPKKVSDRLSKQIGTFQKVLQDAKRRDVNESDTVIIITDMLSEVFGWDKYSEITSEQAIRGTFCDLAVTADGSIQYLVEVKAIGLELKDNHLRQAINYGANHGIPWVVLTNGIQWEIYRIVFEQPISHELVVSFDFLELSPRKKDDHEVLFLLCRTGMNKDAIAQYHDRVQVVNRFVLAALIQSEPVLRVLRRELKRMSPDSKVAIEEIEELLPDVLKRDVLDGESATKAKKQVGRAVAKKRRRRLRRRLRPHRRNRSWRNSRQALYFRRRDR